MLDKINFTAIDENSAKALASGIALAPFFEKTTLTKISLTGKHRRPNDREFVEIQYLIVPELVSRVYPVYSYDTSSYSDTCIVYLTGEDFIIHVNPKTVIQALKAV